MQHLFTNEDASFIFAGNNLIEDPGYHGWPAGAWLLDPARLSIDIGTVPLFTSVFTSSLDPLLRVFDSSGNQLAISDDDPVPGEDPSLGSYLEFTANTSGDYYIDVSSFGNSNDDPLLVSSSDGQTVGFNPMELLLTPAISFSEFQIDVVFADNTLTLTQQEVFTDAANRWAQIIIGDLPDVSDPQVGDVDDLVIRVSTPDIDGPGGILGRGEPTFLRGDSLLPITGIMEFDAADLARLEANGQLVDVILHEMGHVLGFGTIWELLELVEGVGGSDPRYVGAGATAEYNDVFGLGENSIPLENTGGPGTRDSHWRESVFDNELMTGFLDSGMDNPISRITAASLEDLGYEVNLGAADPYLPPTNLVEDGVLASSAQGLPGEVVSLTQNSISV